jgi:RNA polymerase sigma factor (sigma-70 family)
MDATVAIGVAGVSTESTPLYVAESIGFDELYRREYPGLYAVALTMAGGMNDPDDLVQDTMVKAFVHWRKVRRLERPGGWCHRVLLNLCRDWYRRRRIEARFVSRQRRVEPFTAGPSGDALAFCQAVHRLPTRPRAVVALYYVGDHSVAEVASILGVPEGTVRSDLSRARLVLAAELGV